MLSEMTRAEKADLLRWIARDMGETSREYAYIADPELGVVHDSRLL